MKCLTLLSVASIQDYIFRSNRLKENIGASWLVERALKDWESNPRGGKVLFRGGGNAALIFQDRSSAEARIWEWSLRFLSRSSGLRFAVAHADYKSGDLSGCLEKARKDLSLHENAPPFGFEPAALPVTRTCAATGLASVARDSGAGWVGSETLAKRSAVPAANGELRQRYIECLPAGASFPDELDRLGTEEGAGHIAIVHADGNGIGDLLRKYTAGAHNDQDYQKRLSECSDKISGLALSALQETLKELTRALPQLRDQKTLKIEDGSYPVRPLVDGGDDLTFVCHGKLGLHLAIHYLRNFESLSAHLFDAPLSACAGVLIMPHKFPFARGYRLSEQLVAKAKTARRKFGNKGSWLDFHIVMEGANPSLDELRGREYQSGNASLLSRPLCLGQTGWAGWESFEETSERMRSWPRSRVKTVLQTLAKGPAESERLKQEFASRGFELPAEPWELGADDIWRTSLFDPLEATDFYPLWPKGAAEAPGVKP